MFVEFFTHYRLVLQYMLIQTLCLSVLPCHIFENFMVLVVIAGFAVVCFLELRHICSMANNPRFSGAQVVCP